MIAPLRLDEDLVAIAVGESDDLVLDRRAVARPGRRDPTCVQRRPVEVAADDRVRLRIREGDVAVDLGCVDGPRLEGKRHRIAVARLPVHRVKIDRGFQDARRRPGLQSPHRQAQTGQSPGQPDRGLLLEPATWAVLQADVQLPA